MLTKAVEQLREGSRFAAEAPNLPVANLRGVIGKAVLAFASRVMKNFTSFYGTR